jgi:hypothetical protein
MEWLEAEGLIAYPEGKQHRRMFRVTLTDYWAEEGATKGASRGENRGATKGASNPHASNDLRDSGAQAGARTGAQQRAQAGAQLIVDVQIDKTTLTVPTEPSAPVAPRPDADLFGESLEAVPQSKAPPKEAPKEQPAEVDAASAVAQRVVALFHDLSKSTGGNGVAQSEWGGQRKIAANAVRSRGIDEESALGALRWGMRDAYWRQRLRAQGLKLLQDVWSAWIEENLGKANGNGRNGNGTGGVARGSAGSQGESGAGQGGERKPVVVNGRWERH